MGVPVIGCDCEVCVSEDPRDKRTRSSLYIQTREAAWVIDTGPDFRTQCLREGLKHLDAVVYTHSHTDHIMGFDDLRRFCTLRNGSIPIYANAETMADLQRVFDFAFNGLNRFPGYVLPEPVVVNGAFNIGETEIIPLKVPHGRASVFGYLHMREGKKLLAYISDAASLPDEVIVAAAGVDTLVVDALRYRKHPTHMNIDAALEAAARIRPRVTYFTHLCDEVMHARTQAEMPPDVVLAHDGLKISAG